MKFCKTILIVLFSIVYVPLSYAVMGLGGILFVLMRLVGVSHGFAHKTSAGLAMKVCLYMTLSKVRVIYDPNYDPQRRSMYAQNHVSMIDGHVACASIPHEFCGLMNAWHFHIPCYGWIMRCTGGIPVFPHKAGRTAEVTAAAQDRIQRGLSILVYPEGHRTVDMQVAKFKRGVFFMARDANIPVVPMAVHGIHQVNRKGKYTFTPGEVTVYVGAQIETTGLTDDDVNALAERTRDIVSAFADTGVVPIPMDKKEILAA